MVEFMMLMFMEDIIIIDMDFEILIYSSAYNSYLKYRITEIVDGGKLIMR